MIPYDIFIKWSNINYVNWDDLPPFSKKTHPVQSLTFPSHYINYCVTHSVKKNLYNNEYK